MDSKDNNSDFEEYRRKMHHEKETESRSVVPSPKRAVAIAFGIFMIIVYVGVGVLLLVNFFRWDANFTWVRIVLGILLILYGVFRAYRQFIGSDYYDK